VDLFLRHSTAAHKRETIAWAKRRQASAEKLAIFQVLRNYVKRRWENGPAQSPAMIKGLASRLLKTPDILSGRVCFVGIRPCPHAGHATTIVRWRLPPWVSTAGTPSPTPIDTKELRKESTPPSAPGDILPATTN